MSYTRRDLAILIPALVKTTKAAQETKSSGKTDTAPSVMKAKTYPFDEMQVRTSSTGLKSRSVFNGVTTRGQRITLHISELAPGQRPHPPERQPHEEVIILREGTLEVTLNGEISMIGPGSVIFSSYNNLSGWKNVGTTTAQYYVLSLEEHSA